MFYTAPEPNNNGFVASGKIQGQFTNGSKSTDECAPKKMISLWLDAQDAYVDYSSNLFTSTYDSDTRDSMNLRWNVTLPEAVESGKLFIPSYCMNTNNVASTGGLIVTMYSPTFPNPLAVKSAKLAGWGEYIKTFAVSNNTQSTVGFTSILENDLNGIPISGIPKNLLLELNMVFDVNTATVPRTTIKKLRINFVIMVDR